MKIFADYLDKFMKVIVYGTKVNHIEHPEKYSIKCHENGVSLNSIFFLLMHLFKEIGRACGLQRRIVSVS